MEVCGCLPVELCAGVFECRHVSKHAFLCICVSITHGTHPRGGCIFVCIPWLECRFWGEKKVNISEVFYNSSAKTFSSSFFVLRYILRQFPQDGPARRISLIFISTLCLGKQQLSNPRRLLGITSSFFPAC